MLIWTLKPISAWWSRPQVVESKNQFSEFSLIDLKYQLHLLLTCFCRGCRSLLWNFLLLRRLQNSIFCRFNFIIFLFTRESTYWNKLSPNKRSKTVCDHSASDQADQNLKTSSLQYSRRCHRILKCELFHHRQNMKLEVSGNFMLWQLSDQSSVIW